MWFENDKQRTGENMIKKVQTFDELVKWADKDSKTVIISEGTGKGQKFDELRKKGKLVLGGGALNDKMENDRAFGQEVAKAAGMRIPSATEVSNIDDAIKTISKQQDDEEWYFKPSRNVGTGGVTYCGKDVPDLVRYLEYVKHLDGDMPGILQKKIDGLVLNMTGWWTGKKFIGPYSYLIEYKKMMAGNNGPNTGSALNTIWFMDKLPRLAKELHWNTFEGLMAKLEAVPGTYDVNAVIPEHGAPYFLEMGPRFGYDYDLVWLPGLTRELGETVYEWATGTLKEIPVDTGKIYSGVRVSLMPYPWESLHSSEKSAMYEPIDNFPELDEFSPYGIMMNDEGKYEVGDPWGLIGVMIASTKNMDMNKRLIYNNLKELRLANACFRSDYGQQEKEDIKKLKGLNYEIPKGM